MVPKLRELSYHVLDGAKDRNKDIASMKLSWDASKVLLSINPDVSAASHAKGQYRLTPVVGDPALGG